MIWTVLLIPCSYNSWLRSSLSMSARVVALGRTRALDRCSRQVWPVTDTCRLLPGGSFFGLLSKNSRFGRNPVVLLGVLVHFVAFYLIFLNMPADAPIAPVEGTNSSAYIKPRCAGHPLSGTRWPFAWSSVSSL